MNIKNSIKSIGSKKYYIPFIIFFMITLIINLKVGIEPGDDIVYRDTFTIYSGFKDWANDFYNMWGGRLIPIYLLIIFLSKRLIFWKIANSIIFTMLAIGIYMMCVSKESKITDSTKLIISIFSCGIIFFIPMSVMKQGALWVTGSFNYIWPMAFCIFAIIPYKRLITGEESKWYVLLISLLSAVYASNIEQTAAVMLAFASLAILFSIIKRVKINLIIFINWFVMVALSLFSLLARGNSVRSNAEVLRWYQDYDMLSSLDKVFLGCNITFNHVIKDNVLLLVILSIMVCVLVNKRSVDKITKLLSIIPTAYICTQLLEGARELSFTREGLILSKSKKEYANLFMVILIICILSYLIFTSFEDYRLGIVCLLFFAAALCASIVMGFSPTIYASGARVFYVTDILLGLSVIMVFTEYISKEYITREIKVSSLTGILFLSFALILRYILK